MAETDDARREVICAQMKQAGISDAQINLALETSGELLDQLASYQCDDRHRRTVRDIFADFAPNFVPAGDRQ